MLVEKKTATDVEELLATTITSPSEQQQRTTELTFSAIPISQIIPDGAGIAVILLPEFLLLHAEAHSTLITLKYTEIVLHAAISEPPSLYLQAETPDLKLLFEDQESVPDLIEIFLHSKDVSTVQTLYAELCKFAALCPQEETEASMHELTSADQIGGLDHYWFSGNDEEGRFEDSQENGTEHLTNGQANGSAEDTEDQPRKYLRTS